MKINKLFAAVLAAGLVFTSCVKTGPETNSQGEETFATFSVSIPGGFTRAEDPTAGFTDESKINSIGVYIHDTGDNTFHYDVKNVTDFTPDGNGKYTATFAVKTTTGTKNLFVVANPTTAVKNSILTKKGTVLGANEFGHALTEFNDVATNGLIMSGVYYDTTLSTRDITLAKVTSANALLAPYAVEIFRNVAKVIVEQGSKSSTPMNVIGGTTTLTYALMVEAKDAYLLPMNADATTGKSSSTAYTTVPSSAQGNAADPFWSNFTGVPTTGFKNIEANQGAKNAAMTATTGGFYTFENVITAPYDGNVTRILIKGVFEPTAGSVVHHDGTNYVNGNADADKTFWTNSSDGKYYSTAGMTKAVADGLFANSVFVKYEKGVGYYTVPVQDTAAKWGVERNHFYQLNITEVNGPGKPSVIVNPNVPVAEDSFLSVEVNVHPWNYQNWEGPIQ